MKNVMFYLFMVSFLFIGQAQELKQLEKNSLLLKSLRQGYSAYLQETYPDEFRKDPIKFLTSHVDIPEFIDELKEQGDGIYTISCKSKKGSLIVRFNENGEIIKAVQRFKDIPIPHSIIADIYRDHKGWEVTNVVYRCISKKDKPNKQSFVVKLKKNNKKKKLRISPSLDTRLSKV
ncbi:hypothetical protein GCM10009433_04790 [Psychroflexus lacisalsi]|jgi:hypothetical protein|uniref:Uncharacterized protein n=2 Tax=Psychroflexus lacisalsi TaxID=503928 RepID=A0ABN1K2K7_9FLAO